MTTEEIVAELAKTAEEDAPGRSMPGICYHDPEFFALEVERVLRPGWHAVARWDELEEPGDYKSVNLFGEDIVVLRDQSGTLRALSRICQHRGHTIVEGSGNSKRITCPYHLWTYNLEGELVSAPFMDERSDFKTSDCKLPKFALEEWQGFILVNLDPNAEPLAPQLTDVDEILSESNLNKAVVADVTDWDSPWNWKVMLENFMESYHHIGPHSESLQKSNPAKGTHEMTVHGPCIALENPAAEGESRFWVFQIFPTLLFAQNRKYNPIALWYEMQIDRHDHIHLRIHMLMPPELAAQKEMVEFGRAMITQIHMEDIPVCENVQSGTRSRAYTGGPLSMQESTLHSFHKMLAEALQRIPGKA
ncbi:MAG: hypothetical protein COA73_06675 [Candidatus Hydrogenedentota bacterium]|nr:MAG: hypothetical protein COA73_06675 [Candidatus Hydrogenedentota bacterium]